MTDFVLRQAIRGCDIVFLSLIVAHWAAEHELLKVGGELNKDYFARFHRVDYKADRLLAANTSYAINSPALQNSTIPS